MNKQEKQARLKELSKPNAILSDQELEERDFLEADLNEMDKEESITDKAFIPNIPFDDKRVIKTIQEKLNDKPKRTLFQAIKDKYKKEPNKPVTNADIDQLKKEVQAAELRKKLAELQASTPKKQSKLVNLLKALASNEIEAKKKNKKPSFTI